jgi:putative toxin-antitoxin system antitoxin component (TIGR02293 family)
MISNLTKKAAKVPPLKRLAAAPSTRSRRAAGSGSTWTHKGSATVLKASDFVSLYKSDPLENVRLVKLGVASTVIGRVSAEMGVPKDKLLATLGLPRATIHRKEQKEQALSADESSRVLGISRLIGQVQAMVEASGNPEGFDAAAWVADWLDEPLPALGGQKPAELMDTAEGQAIVSNMLARSQSGAYA